MSTSLFVPNTTLIPLTTDDKCTPHATLAVRAIHFEDRFCASQMGGIGGGGGCHPPGDNTWRLSWLAVVRRWSTLVGPLLSLLARMGSETAPLPL